MESTAANPMTPRDVELQRLVELHRFVLRAQALERRLADRHRQGLVGEHHPYAGEESALVGAAASLDAEDWMVCEGAELPLALVRGAPIARLLGRSSEAEGNALSSQRLRSFAAGWRNGAHVTHGVGVAWGMKIARKASVVLVTLSDVTLAAGELHNGLNFAGVFKAPVVFLARLRDEAGASRVAERARAYGVRGVACDGADLRAVMAEVREARAAAIAGHGATWIEARIGGMMDDVSPLRRHLEERRAWDAAQEASAIAEAEAELEAATSSAEAEAASRPEALFEHTFHAPTWNLSEQRDRALATTRT